MVEKYIDELLALVVVIPAIALEFIGSPTPEWLIVLAGMVIAFYFKRD